MKQLSNGCELRSGTAMSDDGYEVIKEKVASILSGELTEIEATCRSCYSSPHSDTFYVEWNTDGTFNIGCMLFTLEDIKIVKEWLAEKPVPATEGRE